MRYYRIMDKTRVTKGMKWLTLELQEKLAELREVINPDARRKLYDEIAIIRQNYEASQSAILKNEVRNVDTIH